MVGLSLLLFIINTALVFGMDRFYPYLYGLAAIFFWGGAWLVVTGQPRAAADGTPAPIWARIGLGAAMAFGLLVGIGMIILPWESFLASFVSF